MHSFYSCSGIMKLAVSFSTREDSVWRLSGCAKVDFARKCSSTKRRIAEDRLPRCRLPSISAINFETVHPSARAISFRWHQKGSSRLMLVLWPSMMTERFIIADFTGSPSCCRFRYGGGEWYSVGAFFQLKRLIHVNVGSIRQNFRKLRLIRYASKRWRISKTSG